MTVGRVPYKDIASCRYEYVPPDVPVQPHHIAVDLIGHEQPHGLSGGLVTPEALRCPQPDYTLLILEYGTEDTVRFRHGIYGGNTLSPVRLRRVDDIDARPESGNPYTAVPELHYLLHVWMVSFRELNSMEHVLSGIHVLYPAVLAYPQPAVTVAAETAHIVAYQ